MASFFISHSSRDEAASERVRDRLKAKGYESVFLDFDPEDGIPVGRDWERELYAQLRRSDAVIFLSSTASLESKWCFAELALARATGKPIFPIALEPAAWHPLLVDTQAIESIDLVGEGDAAFKRLWIGLKRHGFDPSDIEAWDPNRPPFPGLSPLEAEDAAVFFGRDDELEELLGRLQPILESSRRLITVIGPSGSGKSSLVRAGLAPRLHRLVARWVVLPPLRPGGRPLSMLARRLAGALGESDWEGIRDRIARDPAALLELTDNLLNSSAANATSALLIIDQAEELVTADGDERGAFLGALGAALEGGSQLWAVATLRTEYLAGTFDDTAVADVIGPVVMLGPLRRSRIPEVIEGPARRAGLELAPGLVGRMVEETRGGDALPFLAYTLRQLYDRVGPERRLTMKEYEAIGGVLGALRGRADTVAGELERSGRGSLVIPTLLKFANVEQENEPIGRRVLRRNLTADEDKVARAFVEARLLTSDGSGDEAVVGIAHDSLLRSWAPLRQAIDASRDSLRLRSELERLAHEWDSVGRSDSYLLREERLADASRFVDSGGGHEVLPLVQEFVERSRRQSQAALRRESDLLAGGVLKSLDEDPERSLLLAIAAAEEYTLSPRTIRALNAALAASKVRLYLRGHDGAVKSAAYSPDGSRIVTASTDKTAWVWDATSGESLHVLCGHEDAVVSAAYSPDGSLIVTASGDGTARVWNAADGDGLHILRGHQGKVQCAGCSPDGTRVVTASSDQTVRIWDVATGEELQILRGHERRVQSAAYSPDGRWIVTASRDGTARIWDVATGEELQILRGHERLVQSAAYSPDGTEIVSASEDGTVRVWQPASGDVLQVLRGHESWVHSAAYSPDGRRVVAASRDRTARVWDLASGEELEVLRGHAGWVYSAVYAPDGHRIVTASGDRTARVWEVVSHEELQILRRHEGLVYSAAYSPDGSRVVSGSHDGTARVWDAASGEQVQVLRGHDKSVFGAAYSPDGRWIVTASRDRTVRVWEAKSGEQRQVLRGHRGRIHSAAYSPDGTRVVTASSDETARIWDAATGEELQVLRGHHGWVYGAAFSPDGSRVVTASGDRTAIVWEAATAEELQVLRGHEGLVWRAAYSPDGHWIVTASRDGTARVWDSATASELRVLRGHRDTVYSATYSPDGSRILTASSDQTARIWDAATGEELQVLRGHHGWVYGAAYSPEGSRVVTASGDRTARVWEILPVHLLVAKAKTRVMRELTTAERTEYGLTPTPRFYPASFWQGSIAG